jgi:DNA polymerase III alpha subunit (gram-positive type)
MKDTTVFKKDVYKQVGMYFEIPKGVSVRSKSDYIIGKGLGYNLKEDSEKYLESFLNDFNKIDPKHRAKTIAVWDFETTDQHNSFAVSLAIFLYDLETKEIIDTFYEIINPLATISRGAMEVHKITQDEAEACPTFEHFLPRIEEMFEKADFFVGQNLQFDMAVFEREVERLGLPNKFTTMPIFDTMKAAKGIVEVYDKNGKIKAPSLEESSRHYGLEVEGDFHNAAVDVQQTLEVFCCLMEE